MLLLLSAPDVTTCFNGNCDGMRPVENSKIESDVHVSSIAFSETFVFTKSKVAPENWTPS